MPGDPHMQSIASSRAPLPDTHAMCHLPVTFLYLMYERSKLILLYKGKTN